MKDWEVFEHEVRMLVEAFGYKAETTKPSHDYGVDVTAENRHRKIVIQCKLYGKGRIGGETILKLVGSREDFEAAEAIIITTSHFTKQAKEIAERRKIHLVDREKLLALCQARNLTIPSLTALEVNGESFSGLPDLLTFGRSPGNEIVIADQRVSRQHATIERSSLHLTIIDHNSTNGTFVNGKRIAVPTPLNYTDQIVIGSISLQVVFQMPEA